MIIIHLEGGLGNQLFQYAVARYLSNKYNVVLKYDDSACMVNVNRPLRLNLFKIRATRADAEDIASFKDANKFRNKIINWIETKFQLPYYKRRIVQEPHYHFSADFFKIKKDAYLQGYWQSEKYFYDIRDILLNELTLKFDPDRDNKKHLKDIINSESVSIHVRRGDYVKNPHTRAYHGICSLDYYKRALKKIGSLVENPKYYVFSDDPDWTKENLKIKGKVVFIINNSNKEYEDLRLMRACKHNIIANSTFSWWGAWLGEYKNKIVIAPEKWFLTKENNYKDIVPDRWLKIPN